MSESDPATAETTEPGTPPRSVDLFLGNPTRELEAWAWLFTHDVAFPAARGRGLLGLLRRLLHRLLRPLLRVALADLFERQRVFNLIVLETLVQRHGTTDARLDDLKLRMQRREAFAERGLKDVMRHNDALFARVDQKLDRYRREARDLWHRAGALANALETDRAESERPATDRASRAVATLDEQGYMALERRWRGTEAEISERVAVYLSRLREHGGPVLDLGCGRGEALAVFADADLVAVGVDASAAMVEHCTDRGLTAEVGDLFEHLAGVEESSLGAVTSFHVIEHLEPSDVARLVRLAWRALRPGGLLILETPSPLALAMAARDFWIDPTHRRPVHPAWLEVTYREAGFEPVHRLDLRPFDEKTRLPEIDLASLPADQHALADQINRLRDPLDELLYGARDFALIGEKPSPA